MIRHVQEEKMTAFTHGQKEYVASNFTDLPWSNQKLASFSFEGCNFETCDFTETEFSDCEFIGLPIFTVQSQRGEDE